MVNTTIGVHVCEMAFRYRPNSEGFYGRISQKKLFISEISCETGLTFLTEYLHKLLGIRKKAFSDVSIYNLFGSVGGKSIWGTEQSKMFTYQ